MNNQETNNPPTASLQTYSLGTMDTVLQQVPVYQLVPTRDDPLLPVIVSARDLSCVVGVYILPLPDNMVPIPRQYNTLPPMNFLQDLARITLIPVDEDFGPMFYFVLAVSHSTPASPTDPLVFPEGTIFSDRCTNFTSVILNRTCRVCLGMPIGRIPRPPNVPLPPNNIPETISISTALRPNITRVHADVMQEFARHLRYIDYADIIPNRNAWRCTVLHRNYPTTYSRVEIVFHPVGEVPAWMQAEVARMQP